MKLVWSRGFFNLDRVFCFNIIRSQNLLLLKEEPSPACPWAPQTGFTHRMWTGHSLLRSTFAHKFDPDTACVGLRAVIVPHQIWLEHLWSSTTFGQASHLHQANNIHNPGKLLIPDDQ